MPLSPAQLKSILSARRGAVRDVCQRLPKYWQRDRWLSIANKYRDDCTGQIHDEYDAAEKDRVANSDHKSKLSLHWKPSHRQLCDYIAASTLTHCTDGWAYLGQAISAELAGAPDIARHLGYYAELRAAMSLLAGEGVGIFSTHHVAVIGRAKCELIPMGDVNGTHQFTWATLKEWAESPAGVDTLQRSIRPGGVPLREWTDQLPASVKFVATHWLKQWGLDLSRLANDREARNLVSYRPTAFTSPGPTAVTDTIDAVTKFWKMCEPAATGGFPVLDRHLLRRGVELAFETSQGRTRLQARASYQRYVKAMLHGVAPTELSEAQWERFLVFDDEQEIPRMLLAANSTSGLEDPNHSEQVLARAALLLRVATGSVADLLSDVVSRGGTELEFWWSSNSVRRNLWADGSPPAVFSDLWVDVREAAESVVAWVNGAEEPCRYGLWKEQARQAFALATTERVALWGLGL